MRSKPAQSFRPPTYGLLHREHMKQDISFAAASSAASSSVSTNSFKTSMTPSLRHACNDILSTLSWSSRWGLRSLEIAGCDIGLRHSGHDMKVKVTRFPVQPAFTIPSIQSRWRLCLQSSWIIPSGSVSKQTGHMGSSVGSSVTSLSSP